MASRYDDFLARGVRIAAIDIDSPAQHSAMIEKLGLPFPMLSDPDRSGAIEPFGVADPKDRRDISRPAMVLVGPDGEERFRFVSRDYADRYPIDEVLAEAAGLGLDRVETGTVALGPAEAGTAAMPFEGLAFYLRGARFAAQAMGLRHKDLDESIKEDSKAYVSSMDEMLDAISEYAKHR